MKNNFFLGIGAEKAGTTWLHKHLKKHSQIAVPPIKELKFFSHVQRKKGRPYRKWFTAKMPVDVNAKKRIKRAIWHILTFRATPRDWWIFKFSLVPRKVSAIPRYIEMLLLLKKKKTKVIGEITPSYMSLKLPMIKQVYHHFPDLKIIILLRDPVQRDWSAAKMRLLKFQGKGASSYNEKEFEKYLFNQHRRLDFPKIIQYWLQVYPPNQLQISFFDEIQNDPKKVLQDVFSFLEVDTSVIENDLLNKIVNQGVAFSTPTDLERKLFQRHEKMLKELALYFKDAPINYPQLWLHKYQQKYGNSTS